MSVQILSGETKSFDKNRKLFQVFTKLFYTRNVVNIMKNKIKKFPDQFVHFHSKNTIKIALYWNKKNVQKS